MTQHLSLVWFFGLSAIVLAGLTTVQAEEVAYTDDNIDILVGVWKGKHEAKNGGKVVFRTKVTLKVESPNQGEFTTYKKNRSWVTDIEAKNGSPWLTYGREMREFALAKSGGRYQLEVEYKSTYQGYKNDNTLILTRQ